MLEVFSGPASLLRDKQSSMLVPERLERQDKLLRVRMLQLLHQLLARSGLDDPAVPHNGDAVANAANEVDIMRKLQKRHLPLPLNVPQQLDNLSLNRYI